MDATLAGQDFIQTYQNPDLEVSNRLQTQKLVDLEEKKILIKKIIETIVLCGRQNITLRGHRDSGRLTIDAPPDLNDGNLRSLLRFRAQVGDEVLKRKLLENKSKLKYISPQHQNEFIRFCGEEIQEIIRTTVLAARFFAIMFDESPDISHISQMSLVLRYVDCTTDPQHATVREDFIKFIDAQQAAADMLLPPVGSESVGPETESINDDDDGAYLDDDMREEQETQSRRPCPEPILSGEVLGKIAIKAVTEDLGLDINNCVAVATDSCSVMMSEARGAVAEILKVAKHAVKTPCGSHVLNNSLSQSSKVQQVKTTSSVMQQTSTFMNSSSKRNFIVRDIMKKAGMPKLCETRFIERHDAYLTFRDDISSIIEVLQETMSWNESKAVADAQSLILSLTNPAFIVTLVCMCDIFALTLPLAYLLQKVSLDVATASEHINDVISSLEEKRRQADGNFSVLFSEATEILEKLGDEVVLDILPMKILKHILDRQTIYIPILDAICEDIKERFSKDAFEAYNLAFLMPKYLKSAEFSSPAVREQQTSAVTSKYWSVFASSERSFQQMFLAELNLWERKWGRVENSALPDTAVAALDACDKEVFPIAHGLLKILSTLPSSTCTAERSFSTLRRLKTYLRSTMRADRLTGLALLNIHREVQLNLDSVVERFLKCENRRL
ncbi:52 kDa repressor of the inhibitor of the protein kinase [Frankliniella fusca]|uniref:52 kDa repressor of the inhibitor of the protein kinase n=1 Tax=Frankliniella fusca TaxID=407009 RepID=A0AAE1LD00_9NEOP|nr:52 kDa repressor of the inhibitor of the protein kinase [Frankliniella fusca]